MDPTVILLAAMCISAPSNWTEDIQDKDGDHMLRMCNVAHQADGWGSVSSGTDDVSNVVR